MTTCVIFGGTGFIGSFFAEQVLNDGKIKKVILADIKPICELRFLRILQPFIDAGTLEYVNCDVRNTIATQLSNYSDVSLIANFAAIHREPGHQPHEYYETNLLGAENVCDWASKVDCSDIIFTSSIAPYGPCEEPKSETDVPVPISPYGGSKLAAEKIHLVWSAKVISRHLTIVRPGVVFGPGEGGNVSRLIKATLKGYFFFMGNKETRKAGTYVKELTRAMLWVHQNGRDSKRENSLFNMTMTPAPSMNEYVNTIQKVAGTTKKIPTVPFWFLYPISFVVEAIAKLVGISQPISPVRLRKLVKSNYIVPDFLIAHGYEYKYSLNDALSEWKTISPEEWPLKK